MVNPFLPNGEKEITDSLIPVTENTTENTTENKDLPSQASGSDGWLSQVFIYGEQMICSCGKIIKPQETIHRKGDRLLCDGCFRDLPPQSDGDASGDYPKETILPNGWSYIEPGETFECATCDGCKSLLGDKDTECNHYVNVIDGKSIILCSDCYHGKYTTDTPNATSKCAEQGKPTMQEVDAAIYGTRDEPVKVEPLNGNEIANQQKQADKNLWKAVQHVWAIDDNGGWKVAKFVQFFTGTIKKTGKYKSMFDYQLTERPADALEVIAFGKWYRAEYDGVPLPENGEKLRTHFSSFRGSGERYDKFMRQAERTVRDKLPEIVIAGVSKPPQADEPEGEQELIKVSPEKMQEIYDSIGKGGVK
jgi:hypothetical protein